MLHSSTPRQKAPRAAPRRRIATRSQIRPKPAPITTPARSMAKPAKGGKSKGGDSSTTSESGEFDASQFKDKMNSFVEAYTNELANVKVGRATPEMLEDIIIDLSQKGAAKGQKVPLKSISQIYVKPPASLVVSLNDHTDQLAMSVSTAISGAGLDLNPVHEEVYGAPAIVVPFPKPTKELRESLIKQAKTKAEETKINIRSQRKNWNDAIKKAGLPKDDAFRQEKECQKETDKCCDAISDLASKKEREINSV